MRISTQDLKTFMKCPILFALGRHYKTVSKELIESLRHAVEYLYSYQYAHGSPCNFNALIKRWNQMWWGKKKPDDPEAIKLSNSAYAALDKYYGSYIDIDSDVCAVNFPYEVGVGSHVITGTWPVILSEKDEAVLYYPFSQKSKLQLIRDVVTKADVVAMHITTGNPPVRVVHSRYLPNSPNGKVVIVDEFYPKKPWLNKSVDALTMIITAMEKGMIWGNCHACATCDLRNKCTG